MLKILRDTILIIVTVWVLYFAVFYLLHPHGLWVGVVVVGTLLFGVFSPVFYFVTEAVTLRKNRRLLAAGVKIDAYLPTFTYFGGLLDKEEKPDDRMNYTAALDGGNDLVFHFCDKKLHSANVLSKDFIEDIGKPLARIGKSSIIGIAVLGRTEEEIKSNLDEAIGGDIFHNLTVGLVLGHRTKHFVISAYLALIYKKDGSERKALFGVGEDMWGARSLKFLPPLPDAELHALIKKTGLACTDLTIAENDTQAVQNTKVAAQHLVQWISTKTIG
jgi:hypothetical protein